MQTGKLIAVFGLIAGLAGQSHAGFRDALKSAAGSALNEVTGTSIVKNSEPASAPAEGAKNLTSDSVVNAAPAEIKNCVIKDESSISAKESFMKANDFSETDYIGWLEEVAKQLAVYQNSNEDKWVPVTGIPVEGIVFDNRRIKLTPDEASKVFCKIERAETLLAKEYVYFLSGAGCIKYNYPTLADHNRDSRCDTPEASRMIYAIEKCCNAAKKKISSQKYEQAAVVAKMEREKKEAAEALEREYQRKQEEIRIAAEKAEKERIAAQKQEESQKQIQTILAWDDSSAKAKAATMKNKTIVFKALYLGMPAEDAYKIIYRALSNTILSQMGGHDALDVCSRGSISTGPNGDVVAIKLDAIAVNALFIRTEGQDMSEFVEDFKKAYGIPKMRISDNWGSWTYTSPDGAKITIDRQKNISLEKVASKEEQKKTFD